MDKIQNYIEKRSRELGIAHPTIEDLNRCVKEWMQMVNTQTSDDFDGYSPSEMQSILYHLFDVNCPVRLADFTGEDCQSVPLFRQVKMLLRMIEKEDRLKLTQTGNLPVRIVKELYSEGATEQHVENGIVKLHIEKDSISVQLARIIVEIMKAVKKQGNKFSLTKRGKELLADDCKLLTELLNVVFLHFNLAYFDRYLSENIGVLGIGFSLILLNKYGDIDQSDNFYAEKYFKAFPKLLLETGGGAFTPQSREATNCYFHRVFNILFYHLGFVEITETDYFTSVYKRTIHRTAIIEKLFKISHPN